MRSGKLRDLVTYQRQTITHDAFGEPDKSWTTLCKSWSSVRGIKGSEMFSANQAQSDVDHRIVTRYRPELSTLGPGDRATWNGKTFDIRGS